jgi:hypothetical protein
VPDLEGEDRPRGIPVKKPPLLMFILNIEGPESPPPAKNEFPKNCLLRWSQ